MKYKPTKKQSAYDIRKEAAKKYSKQQKKRQPKTPAKSTAQQRADKLNGEFDYAETILKAGSSEIAKYLEPMMWNLTGKRKIEAGDSNQYFSVDDTYDGDPNKLFQHVTFKQLPDNNVVNKYLDKIESDPHMSPTQYEDYSAKWHSQSYNTLANRLNLQNFDVLEQIMNSSPAWQIAKRGALDSEQTLDRWLDLYDVMNEAQNTDDGLFDWAIQQIENGVHSINWLINAIDDEIKLILAGKYSHRRKVYNS